MPKLSVPSQRQRRGRVVAAIAGLGAIAVVTGPSVASAEPFAHGTASGSSSEIIDLCGLHLQHDTTWEVRFLGVARGPDGLLYFQETSRETAVYTNLDNGKSLTVEWNNLSKDAKVTDNGDGTLTIRAVFVGPIRVYGPDGTQLLLDTGLTSWEFLVDHGGTPTDPFDDEFFADLGVVKVAGRQILDDRDFCADLQTFLG